MARQGWARQGKCRPTASKWLGGLLGDRLDKSLGIRSGVVRLGRVGQGGA